MAVFWPKTPDAADHVDGADFAVQSGITMRRTTRWLIPIRRTLIARSFAALLIVLTVTPFTAPFATIDAAELLAESGHATLDASVKPAKEVAIADLLPPPVFFAILQPFARQIAAIGPIHLQRLRTTVLRV